MKTTQHTPLPWRIADSSTIWSGDQPVCTIAHEENSNLSAEEADANQAFIVTACNAHYELLELVQRLANNKSNEIIVYSNIRSSACRVLAAIQSAQGKE